MNALTKIDPIVTGKIALTIIIIVIAVVIALKIIKFSKKENTAPGSDETIKPPNPKKLNHSQNQFSIFADALNQAMDSSHDDEKAIYAVFEQLRNIEDVEQLIVTYGVRKYVQPLGFWREKGNLIETLHAKLDSGEIKNINNILSSNKVNYSI